MTTMAEVMTAIADTAITAGVVDRAYDWPTEDVNPPCLIVGFPDLTFNHTFRRGSDRATYPVWVVCGVADKRSSRDALSVYVAAGGAAVVDHITGDLGGVVRSASVTSMEIEYPTIGGLPYVAARFNIDVVTSGVPDE